MNQVACTVPVPSLMTLVTMSCPPRPRRALVSETVPATVATLAAVGVCAACVTLAIFRVRDLSEPPGTIAVVAIAVAGLALAISLFNGIRMWVARGLHGEALRSADLRAHLAAFESVRETRTESS